MKKLVLAGITAVGMLAFAVPGALAAPTGEFAVFKQCPIATEGVKGCLVSRTGSGEIVIGNKKAAKEKTAVPIVATQTLQGGFGNPNPETGQQAFYGAKNGETFSKTGQKVPGGLLDLVKCNEVSNPVERFLCEGFFENGATGVTAVTELAKPAGSIYLNEFALEEELPFGPYPPALVLPVKIKLENRCSEVNATSAPTPNRSNWRSPRVQRARPRRTNRSKANWAN